MGMNSALKYYVLAEELARGEALLFTMLLAGVMAMRPAVSAGNKAALDHFTPGFKRDDQFCLGCFEAAEPGGCRERGYAGQGDKHLGEIGRRAVGAQRGQGMGG
ncbi:MAG: hypothetical protein SWK76_03880 [Actinomycetota bacterium]|nr:hypothetical protein [Actinomycetota bacterium]